MDEVEKLQNELRLAFASGPKLQLSERNMIEILLKLRELKMINFLHTSDGKEYLTPTQVEREISSEIMACNGRIAMSELKNRLNVDFNHIEDGVARLLKRDGSIIKLQGELFSPYYLDSICEEINEALQESGRMELSDIAKMFTLPIDFVESIISRRLNVLIQGRLKQNVLYTQAYVDRLQHRIKGIFSGICRPTDVASIITRFRLTDPIVYDIIEEGAKKGRLLGTVMGRRERAQYIPHVFTSNRDKWIENIFKHNKYVEYDALRKLFVSDPRKYLTAKFPNGMCLETFFVSAELCNELNDTLEVALEEDGWKDAQSILSVPLSDADYGKILAKCLVITSKTGILMGSRYVVSSSFLEKTLSQQKKRVDEDQLELAREGKLVLQPSQSDQTFSDDEDDAPKSKSKGGKATKASKGKSSKKASRDDDFEPRAKAGGKKNVAAASSADQRIDLPHEYLEDCIQKAFPDVDEALISLVVAEQRSLITNYQAQAREAAIKAMFEEQHQNSDFDGKITALYGELLHFQKSLPLIQGGMNQF
eukprot:TRINITY_DN1223_c0_g2_i1.p1 TRINITY_DN1223_c0_g2~~TRINITY_DN1223_c0_g2_i1.p1  ORF type:complete len:537 (-),score=123.95 TRINITY_DN1223_c0_g2_i1:888-2498(-)